MMGEPHHRKGVHLKPWWRAVQITAREGLWRLTRDVEDANAGWARQRVLTLDADAIQKALQGQEKEVVRLEKRLPPSQVLLPAHPQHAVGPWDAWRGIAGIQTSALHSQELQLQGRAR